MDARSTLWQVGRYEILCELGRGGMATVYLARQTDLDREVALKELNGLYARDPSFLERFLRESRVAGSLNHPNIVTVHEYFEHEGTPYIAMEFVDGGSMRPIVTSLTLPQVFGVLEQLCSALAHAERTGIVHRDLKPENVLVTAQGTVKIADFGIAKAINDAAPGRFVTGTGMMLGTPTYMAPEQALGTNIGPWSDLYSLGVIAYEMLVGHVPFHETTTPMAILVKHMHEEIPPPRSVKPSLDPELSTWIERLLVKDPASRTRRAGAAWEELEEIVLSLLGPRWRREARLPVDRLTGETITPLTPAELRDESREPATGDDDSLTLLAGEAAGAVPPTDVAVPPTVSPEPDPEVVGAPETEQAPVLGEEPAITAGPQEAPATHEAVAEPAAAPPAPPGPATPAPTAPRRPSRRRVLLAAAAVGVAAVAAVVVALVASGGGSEEAGATGTQASPAATETAQAATSEAETASTEPTPAETPAPVPLPDVEPVWLAVAEDALIVADPGGRVAALDLETLEQTRVLADPALPDDVVTSGSTVVVADAEGVTAYSSTDGVPAGTAKFGPGASLAAAGGTVAAVRETGQTGGRLCILSGTSLKPCADLAFRPAGVAVTSDGSGVLVANPSDEPALVPFTLEGNRLVEQNWIRLDARPTGAPAEFRGRAYAPVEGGVAEVDLASGTQIGGEELPATPSAVTVVPGNGKLFAALPGSDQLALIDTLAPEEGGSAQTPLPHGASLVAVGSQPVALANAGGVVYVATSGDGTIARVDALTGDVLGALGVPALEAQRAPKPVTVTGIQMKESSEAVTATIRLEGGRLPGSGIVVSDENIGDGRAVVELWQGGISSSAAEQTLADLTVVPQQQLARIRVVVRAPAGAFERFEARRSANGAAVTLVATKTPPPEPASSSSSSSSSSSGGGSSSSSSSGGSGSSPSGSGSSSQPEPSITVG